MSTQRGSKKCSTGISTVLAAWNLILKCGTLKIGRDTTLGEVNMGKIGEFEKTVVSEPLREPLPAEKTTPKVPEEPQKKTEKEPAGV